MKDKKYDYIYEMIGEYCLVHDMKMGSKISGKSPEILLREKLKKYANIASQSDPKPYTKIDWDTNITKLVDDLKQIWMKKMKINEASVQAFLFYVLEDLIEVTRGLVMGDDPMDAIEVDPDEMIKNKLGLR